MQLATNFEALHGIERDPVERGNTKERTRGRVAPATTELELRRYGGKAEPIRDLPSVCLIGILV